ncbi:hypothetical protein ABID22_002870 [Pontibacter aydingkolensis]|uniref:Outer membrane protein beta-barrel domain-containing protein n=1 Tax=Pontibacter aydingkolensis TaxID=1911536 RepID=A0ABS7CX65_9BACT|nr:hypothetical protein [Pontibacter aydingkolensis]MBW7468453.1 hypothetical protein [Pontibacter aydingkolensis]
MKLFYTCILSLLLCLATYVPGFAQEQTADTVETTTLASPAASAYHLKAQFAGGIGFLSAGVGRTFFNEKLETDLFLGYLPESIGGDRIVTSAIKVTYRPVKPIQLKAIDWQPLRIGAQVSYTFGSDYFVKEPGDKYIKGYYGFPTALHGSILLGGQIDFTRINKLNKFSAYYEFGSSMEYLISYIQNPKYLSPAKIFKLALGVRMRL